MYRALQHANRLFARGLTPSQVIAQGYRDGFTKGEMILGMGLRVRSA